VRALRQALPNELKYLISDNAKIFIAKAMEEFLKEKAVVHVKITPGRANTNGIAERFVRSLKEMLKIQEWKNIEELKILLSTLIEEYNNRPHQGLNGLSPNEYERRSTAASLTTTSLATA
jgi:transposase InsO family protein